MSELLVTSVAPVLLFTGTIVTLYIQQRNLRKENSELRKLTENSDLLRFVQSLQAQVKTNYEAFQNSEESRKDLYVEYLKLQDDYAAFRAKYLYGGSGTGK